MDPAPILHRFQEELRRSLASDAFVRLTLSQPVVESATAPARITARCVLLQGTPHLSLTSQIGKQAFTRNLPIDEVLPWLAEQIPGSFRSARLATTERDWQISPDRRGNLRLTRHAPSATQPPPRHHDLAKPTLLDASTHPWLAALQLTDPNGKVRPSAAGKYRQLHRYLELLAHLAADCGWDAPPAPTAPPLAIADMGCGKGYLTFGAWHLFHHVLQRPAHITGVELRPELVHHANQLARQLNATGLRFEAGTIASLPLTHLDALIALHACNTATDEAILRGIDLQARLIVVAPCCHQDLRPQLLHPPPLGPILQHGIMKERFAEWITDGLRGLFLEWAGYRTKLLEFVSSEHTPRNLMIAAIRERPAATSETLRQQIIELKAWAGITHHPLDPLLNRTPA